MHTSQFSARATGGAPVALLALATLLALGGCPRGLTALETAQRFWSALEAGDAARAARYVSRTSLGSGEAAVEILPVSDVRLGRIVIDGDRASIDTTVTVDGDRPVRWPLQTALVREGGDWKVDYPATVAALSSGSELALAIQRMRELAEQFTVTLGESMAKLERAMPEIQRELRALEDSVRERVPELQRWVEEWIRELEKSLEEPRREPGTTEV